MTVYLSPQVATAHLAAAQAVLDEHPFNLDGSCLVCGGSGRCDPGTGAVAVFERYRSLPRRQPGAHRSLFGPGPVRPVPLRSEIGAGGR